MQDFYHHSANKFVICIMSNLIFSFVMCRYLEVESDEEGDDINDSNDDEDNAEGGRLLRQEIV